MSGMEKLAGRLMYEIRWHGRGGQGAVTSSKILADAGYRSGFLGVTAAPSFGAERRGAPITASTRLADAPIRVLGDSQMIIRLLLGIYKKARKPSIYLCIEGVKALARRRRWTIAFRYVPRQLNAVPDDMCRRAEAAGEEVRYDLGDSVTWLDVPCSCGSPLPAIRVEGRCDDVIVLNDTAGRAVELPGAGDAPQLLDPRQRKRKPSSDRHVT